jgi:hypothetical protein
MDSDAVCPLPLSRRDAEAVIGLLAVLEGHALGPGVDRRLVDRLSERLRPGVPASGDLREFRQAVNDLNHRVRYALGEYDAPPESLPVP